MCFPQISSILHITKVLVLMTLSTKVHAGTQSNKVHGKPARMPMKHGCHPHDCFHIPGQYEVWLYEFSNIGRSCYGLVSFHTGVGFSDGNTSRYWYFGGNKKFSVGGISYRRTCRGDRNGYFDKKHFLGYVYKTTDQMQEVIDRLGGKKGSPCSYRNQPDDCFKDNYNLASWNCNFFTAYFTDELGLWKRYPKKIWFFRGIG
ncbi:unnamed protein product [Meganyctiphanes norvegica]|uniref:PPPDE domain-containing protein n=1 Tax=Meganyctiphanes norvegica TaxID=48144 RepID=A0AAV2RGJ1_MEGNR